MGNSRISVRRFDVQPDAYDAHSRRTSPRDCRSVRRSPRGEPQVRRFVHEEIGFNCIQWHVAAAPADLERHFTLVRRSTTFVNNGDAHLKNFLADQG